MRFVLVFKTSKLKTGFPVDSYNKIQWLYAEKESSGYINFYIYKSSEDWNEF